MKREQILQKITENPEISVLIIGGGVNGISTFRDLALQGVSVLLVDRADYCSGASAASSHMAHGGVRYLEHGEFRLVREAVAERNRMLENSPHYVKPLPTVIPIFRRLSGLLNAPFKFLGFSEKPAERGSVVIKIGLLFYDSFTGKQRSVPRHQFLSRTAALNQFPQLNSQIINTAVYYDGLIQQPERLCVEMITDTLAATELALALNYVSVSGSSQGTVQLTDELSGETITVKPQVVVNAAGPWIDLANERLGQPSQFIGGTKGSHIVVKHDELRQAVGDREFFFENHDGRIVLLCSLFDRVIIGTSDIRIEHPDEIACTEEEIDYFLAMTKRVFPEVVIDRSHIVFAFTGVRPLPASEANQTGQISRDHSIKKSESNGLPVLNLVGGKWTTHRAFAEQATDQVLSLLGRSRTVSTENLPVGGGAEYAQISSDLPRWSQEVAEETGLAASRIVELFQRYGSLAQIMAREMSQLGPDTAVQGNPTFSRNEIISLVQREQIQHIDDFLLRRSNLAILGKVTQELVQECGEILGLALEWAPDEIETAVQKTVAKLKKSHRVNI